MASRFRERNRSTGVLLASCTLAIHPPPGAALSIRTLLARVQRSAKAPAVPGDDLVGGKFRQQQRRKRVGQHPEDAGGHTPEAPGRRVAEESVHREGATVESAFRVPEADAVFTGGARDAELIQLIVRQFLRGGKANRPVSRKPGRRDRGAGAKPSAAVVDDEGEIGGPGIGGRRGQLRSRRGVSRPLPLKRLSG